MIEFLKGLWWGYECPLCKERTLFLDAHLRLDHAGDPGASAAPSYGVGWQGTNKPSTADTGGTMEPTLQAKLASTSDQGLLMSFAALTHRMGDVLPGVTTAQRRANKLKRDNLRQQRDTIEDEILRRMAYAPAPIDRNGVCRAAGKHVPQEPEDGGDHSADYCPTRQ